MRKSLFLSLFLFSHFGLSQSMILGSQKILKNLKEKGGLYTELTYGSNLKEPDQYDYSNDLTMVVFPTYKLNKDNRIGLLVSGHKGLQDNREQKLSTGYFDLTQVLYRGGKNDFISMSSKYRVYLPIDKERREDTTYQGALYFRPYISFDFKKLGNPYFKFTFRPSFTKNVYDFGYYFGISFSLFDLN